MLSMFYHGCDEKNPVLLMLAIFYYKIQNNNEHIHNYTSCLIDPSISSIPAPSEDASAHCNLMKVWNRHTKGKTKHRHDVKGNLIVIDL